MISAVQQTLQGEADLLSPPPRRQNPLLRQLRTRGEASEAAGRTSGLTPPQYAQDPLLRQLKTDVVDTFKFDFLTLPRREQDALIDQLENEIENEVDNPSSHPKDPLLRLGSNKPKDFRSIFSLGQTPRPRPPQGPRLRAPKAPSSRPAPPSSMDFSSLISQLGGVRQALAGGRPNPKDPRGSGGIPRRGRTGLPSSLISTSGGGVDLSQAVRTPDGRLCVREEEVGVLERRPVLSCSHREEEQCHETYVTYFTAATEQKCDNNFEKKCQISFRSKAVSEPVRSCRRPLVTVCDGTGEEECREEQETICNTRSLEAAQDTRCESVAVPVCGSGCVTREGEQVCQDRMVDSLTQVPEETCDLQPQETCRPVTRLVPSLRPTQECATVPREVCTLQPGQQEEVSRPLVTEWCLEEPGLQALRDPGQGYAI